MNQCVKEKILFIKEWWENDDIVTLITHPRRFGKILNMNMLECFFSNKYKGRGDLFEGIEAQDAINNLYDYLSRYFEKKSSFSLTNMIPQCRKNM